MYTEIRDQRAGLWQWVGRGDLDGGVWARLTLSSLLSGQAFKLLWSVNALGVPRCVCVSLCICAACDFPVLMSVTLTSHSGAH